MTKPKSSLAEAMDGLIARGLLIDSGRKRNGQIVYAVAPDLTDEQFEAALNAPLNTPLITTNQ
jgi:hypothetical protein